MAISSESLPPPGWDGEGLDGLLAAFLPGRLSEIVGPRSSGGGSLLLALLSRATARGGLVALVDAADSLDPVTAARAGKQRNWVTAFRRSSVGRAIGRAVVLWVTEGRTASSETLERGPSRS